MKTDSTTLYISTSSIQTTDSIEAIQQLSSITKNIELSGGCFHTDNLLERLIKIKQQEGINFLIHSYFPPPREHFILNFANTGEKTRLFIKEAMKFADSLGIDYYSVHAGFKRKFNFRNELLFESSDGRTFTLEDIGDNLEWFRREFAYKKIALENLYPNNHNKECCFMIHIDEITAIMERFTDMYLLLDLGHLKISSRLLGFNYLDAVRLLFEKYGGRILEIHLSENDASYDDHLIIHSNSVQYMIVREYARLIDRNGINITIESRNLTIQEISECYVMIKSVMLSAG